VGVGRGEAGEWGQSVRVRQDVHSGARLAPVHGARAREFAPFSPHVRGVEHGPGQVEQADVVQAVQDLLVQPPPDTGSRALTPDVEHTRHWILRI